MGHQLLPTTAGWQEARGWRVPERGALCSTHLGPGPPRMGPRRLGPGQGETGAQGGVWGPPGAHQRIHLKLSESTVMQSGGMVRGMLPCNHRPGSAGAGAGSLTSRCAHQPDPLPQTRVSRCRGREPDLPLCPPARSPTAGPHPPSCPSSLGFSFWGLCFFPPFSRHLLLKTRKRQGCLAAARGSPPATRSVNFMLCKFHFNEKNKL